LKNNVFKLNNKFKNIGQLYPKWRQTSQEFKKHSQFDNLNHIDKLQSIVKNLSKATLKHNLKKDSVIIMKVHRKNQISEDLRISNINFLLWRTYSNKIFLQTVSKSNLNLKNKSEFLSLSRKSNLVKVIKFQHNLKIELQKLTKKQKTLIFIEESKLKKK